MLNPVAGRKGGTLAKRLLEVMENPGCYIPDDKTELVMATIDWLTGKKMAVDKAKLADELARTVLPGEVLLLPVRLPELLLKAIDYLGLPIPLGKESFVKVDLSEWSVEDSFMSDHRPASFEESQLKEALCSFIMSGVVRDFYCPTLHPSYDGAIGVQMYTDHIHWGDDYSTIPGDGTIFFKDGCKLFTGVDYDWWEKKAQSFMPGNSRIGTENEYLAFCGFLIRNLVKEGWSIREAWSAVCNDMPKLPNGVCGFKNLDIHPKILASSHRRHSLRNYCFGGGEGTPVADISAPRTCDSPQICNSGGWIVCELNPVVA